MRLKHRRRPWCMSPSMKISQGSKGTTSLPHKGGLEQRLYKRSNCPSGVGIFRRRKSNLICTSYSKRMTWRSMGMVKPSMMNGKTPTLWIREKRSWLRKSSRMPCLKLRSRSWWIKYQHSSEGSTSIGADFKRLNPGTSSVISKKSMKTRSTSTKLSGLSLNLRLFTSPSSRWRHLIPLRRLLKLRFVSTAMRTL